jgi:hypothetical protein
MSDVRTDDVPACWSSGCGVGPSAVDGTDRVHRNAADATRDDRTAWTTLLASDLRMTICLGNDATVRRVVTMVIGRHVSRQDQSSPRFR